MKNVTRRVTHYISKNSASILTATGIAGVVGTAVLSSVAAFRVAKKLNDKKEVLAENDDDIVLTKTDIIKTAIPSYIPTIIIGASTIFCVFKSNNLNQKNLASALGAYTLAQKSFAEYKRKAEELYGEDITNKIHQETAKENYDSTKVSGSSSSDTKLFYDIYSKQYFNATEEDVISAEYAINRRLQTKKYAYVDDLYSDLGLQCVDCGGRIGWTVEYINNEDGVNWLDFIHETVCLEDSMECTIISMAVEPLYNFRYY